MRVGAPSFLWSEGIQYILLNLLRDAIPLVGDRCRGAVHKPVRRPGERGGLVNRAPTTVGMGIGTAEGMGMRIDAHPEVGSKRVKR